MKFAVDIPDEDLAQIDRVASERGVSRNDILVEALHRYIVLNESKIDGEVFGLWKGRFGDSSEYLEKLRA